MNQQVSKKIEKLLTKSHQLIFEIARLLSQEFERASSDEQYFEEAKLELGLNEATVRKYILLYRRLAPFGSKVEDMVAFVPQSKVAESLCPEVPEEMRNYIFEDTKEPFPITMVENLDLLRQLKSADLDFDSPEIVQLSKVNEREGRKALMHKKIVAPLQKELRAVRKKMDEFQKSDDRKLLAERLEAIEAEINKSKSFLKKDDHEEYRDALDKIAGRKPIHGQR